MDFEKEIERPIERPQGQSDIEDRGQSAPTGSSSRSLLGQYAKLSSNAVDSSEKRRTSDKRESTIGTSWPDRGAVLIFLILVALTCSMALLMRALL